MRARLTKDFTFGTCLDAGPAREATNATGMHGHSFKEEISIEGEVDPAVGWI